MGTWRRTFGATRSRISVRVGPVQVMPVADTQCVEVTGNEMRPFVRELSQKRADLVTTQQLGRPEQVGSQMHTDHGDVPSGRWLYRGQEPFPESPARANRP